MNTLFHLFHSAVDTIVGKTVLGVGFPAVAVVVSHASINAWLTSASLVMGFTVGLCTLIVMIRKEFKKKDK